MPRPKVSVIVPFAGGVEDAERLAESLALLELGPGDEIVVADNSARGVLPRGLRRPRGPGNQGEVVLLRAERRGRGVKRRRE